MFTISKNQSNGFDTVVLKDTTSNTSAVIVPACGGILHAFEVYHNDQLLNVIDNYLSLDDFTQHVTDKGFMSCKMSPFACRIKDASYQYEGKQYTIEKFLLNGSALHGLLYNVPFEIIHQLADENSATLTLAYNYTGTDKGYPFKYNCAVTYQLKANNELVISTLVTNEEEVAIPTQDGWHPYFTFGGKVNDLLLEFQSKEQFEFDEAMVPNGNIKPFQEFGSLKKIGERTFDDCFSVNFFECQPLCVLRDPVQKIQLEIRPDKNYPYLQIYTPPHRNSIAIENLSGVPNCFNNGIGLIILPANEKVEFVTSYTITSL